jgi:Tfp pilus assembly protein PilN
MKPGGLPDLALDFLPPRPGLLTMVLVFAALLIVADAALDERTAYERRESAEQAASKAEKRQARAASAQLAPTAESLLTPTEAKAFAAAERAVGVDWERLFGAIDRAVSDDVALLSLRPSVGAQSLQLGGEARDMAAIHAFIETLRQPPLSRVVLLSHSVRSNEPGRPVAFEISAEWQPAPAR